jgi:uncharacterized membrane protein
MVALTIKIMEIINRRRTDSTTHGRQALCAAREKGRPATRRARDGYRSASKAKAVDFSRAADYSSDFCKTETESA